MWTNQYLQEEFYHKSPEERRMIGKSYLQEGIKRDAWQKDFRCNKKFLYKYASMKYELHHLKSKKIRAYAKRYNMGKNCIVEHNVEISRQHYLPGKIKIGDNVLLAKNVFIDYSGEITIQ